MDALVAYLQMLGTLVHFRDVPPEQAAAAVRRAMGMDTVRLQSILTSIWVVWAVCCSLGIAIWAVMRPAKQQAASQRDCADIPLPDDEPD